MKLYQQVLIFQVYPQEPSIFGLQALEVGWILRYNKRWKRRNSRWNRSLERVILGRKAERVFIQLM
jgi:hypothetical protein